MFEDLEWDAEMIPGIKLGLHIMQIIFAFACFCLGIAVFKGDGSTVNSQNGWAFGVCFLSIPAWIYLIGTPRFPRTRKWAEPHAMVVVDCIFFIFWLSAFASQAAFNTANLCGQACGASKAIVGLGLFVCIFFGITSFLSIYTLKFFQFNGRLPGYDKIQARRTQNIDPDKAAFSMAPHDEEAYGPVPSNDRDDDHDGRHDDRHDGGYGGGMEDPYGPASTGGVRQENPFDDHHDLEYRPQAGTGGQGGPSPFDDAHQMDYRSHSSAGRPYAPPRADDDYDDERPVQFPAGNYDRGV